MRTDRLRLSGGSVETAWWGPGTDEAPTLVLLHEGLGSVGLWRDVPNCLAAATGWGVFAYSRLGYGHSDGSPLPWPPAYMHHEALTVLPEVLTRAGIRRFVLAGHSDGGSIATIYAGGHDPAPDGMRLLGLVTIAAHFFVEDLNITSIEQIKVAYETTDLRARMARHHRDVDNAFRGWNGAWLNPAFRAFNIEEFLPRIRVPVLGLQGTDDPYGSDAQLHVLQAGLRLPVSIQLIPGAKHSPHLEAKEATLAAITEFVADLPAA